MCLLRFWFFEVFVLVFFLLKCEPWADRAELGSGPGRAKAGLGLRLESGWSQSGWSQSRAVLCALRQAGSMARLGSGQGQSQAATGLAWPGIAELSQAKYFDSDFYKNLYILASTAELSS